MMIALVSVGATFMLGVVTTVSGYVINLGLRVKVLETIIERTLPRIEAKLDRLIEGRTHAIQDGD